MTEREATDKWIEENNRDPWRHQDENGIDLWAIDANLKLTVGERIERGIRAIKLMKELRRAGKAARLHNRP